MIERGDIYFADLNPVMGSEQGGIRPVLIIQNDMGNKYSPTVIVAAITSVAKKENMPTHIQISGIDGLTKKSVVLLEQLRTIDKSRLKGRLGRLSAETIARVDDALMLSIGCTCERQCARMWEDFL